MPYVTVQVVASEAGAGVNIVKRVNSPARPL